MTNQKELLGHINEALQALARQPSFQGTQNVVNAVIALLGVSVEQDGWKLFSDSAGKIRSNAHWFMQADGYADRRAVYEIAKGNDKRIDFKTYWVQNTNKSVIHWVTAITPNFEDAPWLASENVGIDFVVPEKADRVLVVLSKEHALRVIELRDRLSPTAAEIFSKWTQPFDYSNKGQFHEILWESFNFEAINKVFYKTISSFFSELKQHLRSKSSELFDDRSAALFVNRLIGRIIFCWFLDKKGILNPEKGYFSMDGADANEHYHTKLETLFFRVLNTPLDERPIGIDDKTPFLNGGLFEAKSGDHEGDVGLSFPADYFDRLYEFLRRYNFTTDESSSAFQQVAIDPEMLGRIFENLLAEQVEETGEQARKAKGAFYTPREIVDYMCKESLREYLKARIPESADRDEQLSKLLDKKPHEFRDQQRNYRGDLKPYKHEILGALDDLTVLDPACGSGAFPMGMLQLLLETYDRLESDYDPYKKKLTIIKNNIFGVDIEPMAVEIARLRAWLSIIVDEDVSNGRIEPLPNLDFKFVCANTLIPLDNSEGLYDTLKDNRLIEIREEYFRARKYSRKQELREKFESVIRGKNGMNGMFASDRERQLKTYQPFNAEKAASFYDSRVMFGVDDGFDIVIGNPPYVSTKGRTEQAKKLLRNAYGFVDDLYTHFYFASFNYAKNHGIITLITSKTFWTIFSKRGLRRLLLDNQIIELCDTANPFDAVMVDTGIVIAKKIDKKIEEYTMRFGTYSLGKSEQVYFSFSSKIYSMSQNQVFFRPDERKMTIYSRLNPIVSKLMAEWWDKIDSSKKIEKNKAILLRYRSSLRPGDFTLIGLITDGGQGLATGNNGKFVGVKDGTKQAGSIRLSRPVKLFDFVRNKAVGDYSFKSLDQATKFLAEKSEIEIADIFDGLKIQYGRDIFGKGYLYKVIDSSQIADADTMTEEQKMHGIPKHLPHFVRYDKGDKDGNRWFLDSPFLIDWSEESVKELQTSREARWQGYNFYFKEGFCWSDIHTVLIKARVKGKGVYDVKSMSLFTQLENIPDWYFVCILNSRFISEYDFTFVNNTQTFQINDARQLPIVIPNDKQLRIFASIYNEALEVKRGVNEGHIDKPRAEKILGEIDIRLNNEVIRLYGLDEIV